MERVILFFKSYWLFILLATLAFGLIAISLFPKGGEEKNVKPTSTPTLSSSLPNWQGIVPGQTSQRETINILGQPKEIKTVKDNVVFNYSTENEKLNHEVFFEADRAALIKEQVFDNQKTLKFYTELYGEPEAKFYGPYAASGFLVYIFTTHGIAVVAHPNSGLVLEVWYFTPMTLNQFLQNWGEDLSQEPSYKL